jgi:hypothetical protein
MDDLTAFGLFAVTAMLEREQAGTACRHTFRMQQGVGQRQGSFSAACHPDAEDEIAPRFSRTLVSASLRSSSIH